MTEKYFMAQSSSIVGIVIQDKAHNPINNDKSYNYNRVDHFGNKLNHLKLQGYIQIVILFRTIPPASFPQIFLPFHSSFSGPWSDYKNVNETTLIMIMSHRELT